MSPAERRHVTTAFARGVNAVKTLMLSYFVTLVVMVALDFVWLGRMGDFLYRPVMRDMALPGFRIVPAVAFYLLFVGGVVYFAVAPALWRQFWKTMVWPIILYLPKPRAAAFGPWLGTPKAPTSPTT